MPPVATAGVENGPAGAAELATDGQIVSEDPNTPITDVFLQDYIGNASAVEHALPSEPLN